MDSLPEEIQENIVISAGDISERGLVKMLASKLVEGGFELPISRAGLHAWLVRKRRERWLAEAEAASAAARDMVQKHAGNGASLEEGTLALLRQRLFEKAGEDLSSADMLALYQKVQQGQVKEKQLALAQQKAEMGREYLKLAQQRLQLNAAKMALDHAEDLRGIIVQGEVGDGEKMEGALARLFGEKFAKAAKGKGGQ